MTESEKDAEIVRLRERYVELLQLLGDAMHKRVSGRKRVLPLVVERSGACRHADRRGSRNVPRVNEQRTSDQNASAGILERSVF
jgi:hypothetical protein